MGVMLRFALYLVQGWANETRIVSTPKVLVLAAIAGFTIFLGLPVGRLRQPAMRLRATLNAGAIGILVFLLFDILSHANEPVEGALTAATTGGRFVVALRRARGRLRGRRALRLGCSDSSALTAT